MQALPSTAQFEIVPTSVGLALILAAALALLAVIVVLTVVMAVGKTILPIQRFKAAAAMLALIVPALLVVGYIGHGTRSQQTERFQARTVVRPVGATPVIASRGLNRESRPGHLSEVRA